MFLGWIFVTFIAGLRLILPSPSVAAAEMATSQIMDCRNDYVGIQYCLEDEGATHIIRIDLASRAVQFDIATASNAKGPNPPAWNPNMRQTVAGMAANNIGTQDMPLAVAMTADYGAGDGTHGWQGLLIRQGERRDGPGADAPDCDCGSSIRSALILSRSKPTTIRMGPVSPEELAEYDLYKKHCAGKEPFQTCQSRFLERTPTPAEDSNYRQRLKDAWYSAVGGGPIIISEGRVIPISEACSNEGFGADWCADNPQASPERMRQLRMGAVAGVTEDGKQLILIVTTARLPNELSQLLREQGAYRGIRFDGSESAQMWYGAASPGVGAELTGNKRALSNALLVYARPLPDDAASPTTALPFDVILPGETADLAISYRNEGRRTWSGSAYSLRLMSGNLSQAPLALPLQGEVPSGATVTWTAMVPVSETPGVHRLSYQLHHNDTPFGDAVTAYVIVLPQQLKDAEQRIRDQIDEWQRQGQQTAEELMQRIGAEIQEEIKRQAASFIENLLRQCFPSTVLLGLVFTFVLHRSRRR